MISLCENKGSDALKSNAQSFPRELGCPYIHQIVGRAGVWPPLRPGSTSQNRTCPHSMTLEPIPHPHVCQQCNSPEKSCAGSVHQQRLSPSGPHGLPLRSACPVRDEQRLYIVYIRPLFTARHKTPLHPISVPTNIIDLMGSILPL